MLLLICNKIKVKHFILQVFHYLIDTFLYKIYNNLHTTLKYHLRCIIFTTVNLGYSEVLRINGFTSLYSLYPYNEFVISTKAIYSLYNGFFYQMTIFANGGLE